VTSWLVNGTPNYGVVLASDAEATADLIALDSSETATVANRPKLTIDYSTGAAYHGYPYPILHPDAGGHQQ